MSQRKPSSSDLSDARWALIEPTLLAWRKARLDRRPTGQPAKFELLDVFNALLFVNRAYYAAWPDEGIFTQRNYDLVGLARVKYGRKPEPRGLHVPGLFGAGLAVERDWSATALAADTGPIACAYGSTARSALVSRATAADNSRGVVSAPS